MIATVNDYNHDLFTIRTNAPSACNMIGRLKLPTMDRQAELEIIYMFHWPS